MRNHAADLDLRSSGKGSIDRGWGGRGGHNEGMLARSFRHRVWVDLAGCLAVVLMGSMPLKGSCDGGATNDLGFIRAGPLSPLLYPAKVSVVVPCYNCGDLVINSFESFERGFELLHDYTIGKGMPPVSCEIVVVDDKSTDSSVRTIRTFIQPGGAWSAKACIECVHPPPTYVLLEHESNQGAGATRNHGVEAATGDVIFFGEADDVFYEHHIPVCWEQLRIRPGAGFVKTRMDAGQELLLSSFRAGEVPVQTLHPHWQVAIEDTSPMNLCLRRDAHMFIGGFPEAEQFVVDMEDGAYMMALFEAYSGVKWLGPPTVLYVRRSDNGLDRRMHQFTSAPGTVRLSDTDEKLGDGWFDSIDITLAGMRDRLAWYQSMDEVMALDVGGSGECVKDGVEVQQREEAFVHVHPSPKATYAPHPPVVVVLKAGCSPRGLRGLIARLMYESLINPARLIVYYDVYNSSACLRSSRVLHSFPVISHPFPASLLAASPTARGGYAAQHAFATWGISADDGEDAIFLHPLEGGEGITADVLKASAERGRQSVREARRLSPDAGGDAGGFDRLEAARDLYGNVIWRPYEASHSPTGKMGVPKEIQVFLSRELRGMEACGWIMLGAAGRGMRCWLIAG